MRRSGAVSNDVVEGRVQSRLRALHRERLKNCQAVICDSPPPSFAHLDAARKPMPRDKAERARSIARENGLLVEKLVSILARKPQLTGSVQQPASQQAHARSSSPKPSSARRPSTSTGVPSRASSNGSSSMSRSLNHRTRTRQMEHIVSENERLLNRLIHTQPALRRDEWKRLEAGDRKHLNNLCRFPYQDPQRTMPNLNPILAIAQATSDEDAEAVLRKQMKRQVEMGRKQQRRTQQLVDNNGIGGMMTSGQLPTLTNDSPLSQAGAAIQPFTPTAAVPSPQIRPTPPPASARPASTYPSSSVKLRAQYTSQGVRILRTGRPSNGGSLTSRPSTALDSLPPPPPMFKAYRPIRAHKQKGNKNVPQHGQKQNGEQRKENSQPHGQTQSLSSSIHTSSTSSPLLFGAPPPESSPIKLYEDTSLVSSRPVLIRIFECGHPWRVDVVCFDPATSLEYQLSLPFHYIKRCFYLCPMLLTQNHRPMLAQTLIHYLSFSHAPEPHSSMAAVGSKSDTHTASNLELTIDLVAPQPRNELERRMLEDAQRAEEQEKLSLHQPTQPPLTTHSTAPSASHTNQSSSIGRDTKDGAAEASRLSVEH